MKKPIVIFFCLVALTGLASPPATPLLVEGRPGYNCWPMIQNIGSRLVCAYSRGVRHSIGDGAFGAYLRTSDDGGRTWSDPVLVVNDPNVGEEPAGAGLDADGAMLFWVQHCGRGAHNDLYRTRDGKSFEKIATPKLDPYPTQLMNIFRVPGVGLMAFWFRCNYGAKDGKNCWGTLSSADNGRTWTQRTVEDDLPIAEAATEQSGVVLKDGRILAIARGERAKCQFQLTSSDGGRTWTKRPTNITDIFCSTPALTYSPETDMVFQYYYERGKGLLKRRAARASEIFGNPTAWPAPTVLAVGGTIPADAGNAKAVTVGDRDCVAYYSGTAPDTQVYVVMTPAPSVAPACYAAAAVNIDCGRQLFVDDWLVGRTNAVVRHWNAPVKHPVPVLRPTAPDGTRVAGCTVATDGGLWWDPTIRKYRLWYETEWAGSLRYAESEDGLRWTQPDLGVVKGTNRVFTDAQEKNGWRLDSWNVWPDYRAANPYAAWKLMVSAPGGHTTDTLFTSSDGRRFTCLGVAGWSGDRTTCHFDPFRDEWVFSLRDYHPPLGRARLFYTQADFAPAARPYGAPFPENFKAAPTNAVRAEVWSEFDKLPFGPRESLYNFDAAPYESLMLGVMEVLHNTPRDNRDSEEMGLPKQTSLRFAFSRDGRAYVPAPDEALRPEGWGSGKWDTGYLSAMGGICTVDDERLRIYYSALRGDVELRRAKVGRQPMHRQGIYYNGAIGYATLRRDGFAGMVADGIGTLETPSVVFSGRHLFVNAECLYGEVAAEILDADGKAFPGFAAADCRGLKFDDTTKRELVFAGGDLSALAGRPVRIRFNLHCATLYSFWVSPSAKGESRGYVAAGGPAYPGLKDSGKCVRHGFE